MKNFNLPDELISSLEKINITTATEIQKQAIPLAMNGADILASSQTGSGKTLAYLLPIINSFINTKSTALVLVPTRELASQICNALKSVTKELKMSSAVLIGGEPMPEQFRQLKNNPKVVIGTPGRIIDHLTRGTLKLNSIGIVVLDEMDRMLDMGMKEQLEEINKYLPEKRQVLMFSATMPKHIVSLSQKYLKDPVRITVGSANKAAPEIKQESLRISDREKFGELTKQLDTRDGSVIIFVKTKRSADQLAKMLKSENHKAEAIHGDLSQRQRERVILSFRQSRHRIMVATDVAARGLDIPHTQHVINYDLPMCPEDYLHRIGRTGRAGATGNALSFICPDDIMRWKAIDRLINQGESTERSELMGKNNRRKPFGTDNGRKSFGGNNRRDDNNPRNNSPRKAGAFDNSRKRTFNSSNRNSKAS
ncbi:DEAD/DEAH box helicase [Rickettsia endosymbiont of Halotydeus destructor]|uniref:DEAD/DEAH box helicase n=1 Tax=Rickettsia endosymbiont of Halotydeus destructor TaxID=2996754 RepID=UPI003BB14E43